MKHQLIFAITQRNIDELERQLLERSTPGRKEYQKWMSFEEIGLLTSNRRATSAVSEWLEDNGAVVTWQSVHGEYLKATAALSIWSKLFNATFHEWDDLEQASDWGEIEEEETQSERPSAHKTPHYLATEYYVPESLSSHLAAVLNIVQVNTFIT